MSNATIRRGIVPLSLSVLLVVAGAGCASPGASPVVGGTPPAAVAGHPLIGTWTVDVARSDFEAAGVTDPGLQNENSGRFLWTFAADGSWTQVQQSLDGAPINNPVFRGTYVVEGDQLIATTQFPEQFQDAGLHYTFAVTGDEARFDLLDPPDATLPVIIESHPWKRGG